MPVEIIGTQYPVEKVFSDDFAFSIPYYQRAFSWGVEQASELYEDLKLAMEDVSATDGEVMPYFLGTVVLVKGEEPKAEIVDGQQRITTLTILLSVLRYLHPDGANSGLTRYIYQEPVPAINQAGRFRLQLRDRDAQFFSRFIQDSGGISKIGGLEGDDLPDSQKRILDVTRYFMEELLREQQQRPDFIKKLALFTLTKCLLIVVSTSDNDSAFSIFSVLNNRGLELSKVDILKADILGRAVDTGQISQPEAEMYAAVWEDLEQSLGRKGLDELVGHIRTIFQKTKKPQERVLQAFRTDVIQPYAHRLPGIIDEILVPLGKALYVIRTANFSGDVEPEIARKLNSLFGWLNRLESSDWVPPAIYFFSKHYDNSALLLQFFADLERLAATFLVLGVEPNARAKRYSEILKAVQSGNDLSLRESPLQLTNEEQTKMHTHLNREIYSRNSRIRMYVLLRLDDTLTDPQFARGGSGYPSSGITIEHVLPKNFSGNSPWLTAWNGCWAEPRVRNRWINKLSNLVLLSQVANSQASNKDFQTKKLGYFLAKGEHNNFALTRSILDTPDWSLESVERRQNFLVGQLVTLWRL